MDDYIGETDEEYLANLKGLMESAKDFLNELHSDLSLARSIAQNIDSGSARRTYIRTMPAFVEGSLNFLKVAPWGFPPLTSKLPEEYIVNFSETMLEFRNRTSVKDSIRDTLIGFGHITDVKLPATIMGEKGAQKLMDAFQLRDYVMHPKSPLAFSISKQQVSSAEEGLVWYMEKFQEVMAPLPEIARSWYKNGEGAGSGA
jgi:hypothetical protein